MSSIVINASGDVHINVAAHEGIKEVLAELKSLGIQLTAQGELIVATAAELNAKLDEANTATNEIAADLAEVIAQLAGGISADDAVALQARLQAHVDALTAVAAVVPEPEVPPVP